jgi:hypothetical protein
MNLYLWVILTSSRVHVYGAYASSLERARMILREDAVNDVTPLTIAVEGRPAEQGFSRVAARA